MLRRAAYSMAINGDSLYVEGRGIHAFTTAGQYLSSFKRGSNTTAEIVDPPATGSFSTAS
jgi:hypothetical protein